MSGPVIPVDSDLNPIRHPSGPFRWDPDEAAGLVGTIPENGYGLPVRELLPADNYIVVWGTPRGEPAHWYVVPA